MSQITTTAGGSGDKLLGVVDNGVTLFTTPNVADAIYIVTVIFPDNFAMTGGTGYKKEKMIVGPNTPVMWPDSTAWPANVYISWNWVQMKIS